MAGLTAEGLVVKRLADIQADLAAAMVAAFGPAMQTGSDSAMGQVIGVFAAELYLVWELAQQLYDSFDPDQAEGAQLVNLAALVGVSQLGATVSTGTVTLTGTAGTVIPADSIVEVGASGVRFIIVNETTLPAVADSVLVNGSEAGPLEAAAGTIDTIITPISGWDTVTNATDITPGRLVESDEELRLRREESLQITGASVDLAIRAAIRAISGVEEALVISNRTAATVNGIPPHSFETVVHPDLSDAAFNATIAEEIYRLQPAGIEAFGASLFNVTDSESYTQVVGFSFATELLMYVEATLTTNSDYPADGDAQVEAALLAEGNTLSVGDDVRNWKFLAALDAIPGIITLSVGIDVSASPTNQANIAVDFRSIASFDSSRVTSVVT